MGDRRPAPHLGIDRANLTGGDQQPSGAAHAGPVVLQPELEGSGEITPGDVEFVVGDAAGDELGQLVCHQRLDLSSMLGLAPRIHLVDAGILVGRDPGVHAVGETTPLADLLEQAARQPSTKNLVHHVERLAPRVVAGQCPAPDHDVHLLAVLVDHLATAHRSGRRPHRPDSPFGQSAEEPLDLGQHFVVGQGSGGGHHHRAGAVVLGEERPHIVGSNGAHIVSVAGRVASKRMIRKHPGAEGPMGHVFW